MAHGKENPPQFYATRLRARRAPLVRGGSRRITTMTVHSGAIREYQSDQPSRQPRRLPPEPAAPSEPHPQRSMHLDRSFHIRTEAQTNTEKCLSKPWVAERVTHHGVEAGSSIAPPGLEPGLA